MKQVVVLWCFCVVMLVGCAPETDTVLREDVTLITNYLGNEEWEYELTVDLPNRCFSFSTEILTAESYPVQITINIHITKPVIRAFCGSTIYTKTETGTFEAQEDSPIDFSIVN